MKGYICVIWGIEFLVIADGFQNIRGGLDLVLEAVVTIAWYYINEEKKEWCANFLYMAHEVGEVVIKDCYQDEVW